MLLILLSPPLILLPCRFFAGRIYITQTYQRRGFPLASVLKPLLYYVTSIDFGQLCFEEDLQEILAAAGFSVETDEVIKVPCAFLLLLLLRVLLLWSSWSLQQL